MSSKTYMLFTTILLYIHTTNEISHYNPQIRPTLYGNRISMKILDTRRPRLQQKIIRYHNYYRSNVIPTASNMLRVKWHKEAANAAQRWASACTFLTHDNSTGRHVRNYGACGQNIFVSTHRVPWLFAVTNWWLEKNLFTFGKPNQNLLKIGHYTQLVWASTHEVGCGVAECISDGNSINRFGTKVFYNYVCNYCPIGNRQGQLERPYKRGQSCSRCKKHCGKNKLCLNPCYAVDQYTNCKDLVKRFPAYWCHTNTPEGRERRSNCLATCFCKRRIHD